MAETQEALNESEFVKLLVRSRILSEGQLKAVYDYQRSVGGSVVDILVKLDMVARSDLEAMLQTARRGGDIAGAVSGKVVMAIDGDKVELDTLKLHHRIIDKLPVEIVETYLASVFFPLSHLDSRRLIVGHGRDLPDEVRDRVRSLLGVDLYTLALAEEAAANFVVMYLDRARKPIPEELMALAGSQDESTFQDAKKVRDKAEDTASRVFAGSADEPSDTRESFGGAAAADSFGEAAPDDTQESSRGVSKLMIEEKDTGGLSPLSAASHLEWGALLNLLVKKRILTREEVRVEIELLKRNQSRA